jgi:hypothetical protein
MQLNSNQQIHTLLCELEKHLETEGKLPDTVYVQIDGGSENANLEMMAMVQHIVYRRVGGVKRMIVSRLPVGHTHEA